MADLGMPQKTIEILKKYDFRIQKKYGQNFLIDPHVLERIVTEAQVGPEDLVVEIGPGLGSLTQHLAEHAGEVVAVEIDRNLIPILEETLAEYHNVTVLNEDILKVDLTQLSHDHGDRPLKVVANLPYYITTPIVMGLLESRVPLKSITVMVQKEVADRMQAGPGTKDYGALSLAVQYRAKASVVCTVPPSCFLPRPAVDSAVIRLDVYPEPPVSCRDPERMRRLIRAAFNQRRKTLANALSADPVLNISRESVQHALKEMGLDELIRGERLSLEEYAKLSDVLK